MDSVVNDTRKYLALVKGFRGKAKKEGEGANDPLPDASAQPSAPEAEEKSAEEGASENLVRSTQRYAPPRSMHAWAARIPTLCETASPLFSHMRTDSLISRSRPVCPMIMHDGCAWSAFVTGGRPPCAFPRVPGQRGRGRGGQGRRGQDGGR